MSLAEKCAYLKRKCRLTTEDISIRSGLPSGTLNKIFSGATKNPGAKTLIFLSDVFSVPLRYLTDDTVPFTCDMGLFALEQGLFMATAEEIDLLNMYRSLSEYDRRSVNMIMTRIKRNALDSQDGSSRILICCIPAIDEPRNSFSDFLAVRAIQVPLNVITKTADLAIQLTGRSLEPAYQAGTLLALQTTQPQHGQLGAFVLNHEGFIRQYYHKHNLQKLVALNTTLRDITISPFDQFECIGTVVGKITNYQWL